MFGALDTLAEVLREVNGATPSDEMMGYFLLGLALGALAEAGQTPAQVMEMHQRMYPVAMAAAESGLTRLAGSGWKAPWKS